MSDEHTIGDAPIQKELAETMNAIASAIDQTMNDDLDNRTFGFVLLAFEFGDHDGRCNYISNATREDVVVLLKEQLARFEGVPDVSGSA